MIRCTSRDCTHAADLAIKTLNSRMKAGLVTTIYQDIADAPKSAHPYCVHCGMGLASGIAQLSNTGDCEEVAADAS